MSDININIPAGAKKRLKTGGKYCPDDVVVTAEGGLDTSDATATPETMLNGRTAYVNGEKITGTMPNRNRISTTLTPSGTSVSGGEGYYPGISVRANYTTRTVTPTKSTQEVSSTTSFYSKVTVNPIPDAYIETDDADATAADIVQGKTAYVDGKKITGTHTDLDTSDATAEAADIRNGETAYVNGQKVTGSMPENNATDIVLEPDELYTIPKGYHSGAGRVYTVPEEKTITPTKSTQSVTPSSGKVLSEVTVNPIPDEYIDTSDADATAAHIRYGYTAYVDGEKVTGSMSNRGSFSRTLTPTTGSVSNGSGYYSSVSVAVASTTGTVTPTKSAQTLIDGSRFYSMVTVNPIPNQYVDTSDATASASSILSGETAYVNGAKITGTLTALDTSDATAGTGVILSGYTAYVDGKKITGTMANKGSLSIALTPSNETASGSAGYYTGISASVRTTTRTVTPTKSTQTLSNTAAYYKTVTVNPIPAKYVDTSDADATAAEIEEGKTAYVNGVKITGTKPKNLIKALKVTSNGTYSADGVTSDGYSPVIVNVPTLDTSDATATAADIRAGKTAYVNGQLIVGTMQ